MAEHHAVIQWSRNGERFIDGRYSRGHRWLFDGGVEVPGSSSPQIVPPPLSIEAAVDPEEALVASLSSCHMLWFLSLAARGGFVVEHYRDEAIGVMGKNESQQLAMTLVTLHPDVEFAGDRRPTAQEIIALHRAAHDQCFIARSLKSEVRCEPVALAT